MNSIVKYSIFLILFLVVGSNYSYAQFMEDDTDDIDTNYIVNYENIFTPRFIIISKRNEFTLTNNEPDTTGQSGNALIFKPNDPLNIGLGFTYKWLGVNLAFKLPFLNNDDDIYGKTRRFDLTTHVYGRKMIFDLSFQWYKGYYLDNPLGIVPGWEVGDPHPSRGDLSVTSFGGAGYYVFRHKKFSYRAAFTFNERQKKSAGSFVLGGGFSWYFIRADSSLTSIKYQIDMGDMKVEKANLGNYYTIGGYAHTFVVKYFYLSLTLGLGLGISSDRLFIEGSNEKFKKASLSAVSVFRASVGYNNDKYYIGLSMFNNGFSLTSVNDIGTSYAFSSFNIYVGYRFYNVFKKKEPLPWLWDLKI